MVALDGCIVAGEKPVKVAYFIDHLRADGTQQVLLQLTKGLAKRDHQQMVVCLNDSWDEALLEQFRSAGIKVKIVGKAALYSGVGLAATWIWLYRQRFDVVITFLFASDVIGRALAKMAGVPMIVSSLRARNVNYKKWQRLLVRSTMPWADLVILNSEYLRDFAIAEEGARPDRIRIIPNGINLEDLDSFVIPVDLRGELGLHQDARIIGSVGRLTHQKGFDVLLEAMEFLPEKDVHLALVGSGEEEAKLRFQSVALGLEDRVHFLGYRRDVPRLLRAFDLYVQPSRFEGMPNALLEAMASGCPVVATAVDGNCELIEDGRSGWLVPPCNPEALAVNIENALNNPINTRQYGDAARNRAFSTFSAEEFLDTWEQILITI